MEIAFAVMEKGEPMNDVISRLSEIRSDYNCLDEKEEPYYRALSEAIQLVSAQPQRTGRWIDHAEEGYVECPFCHSATNCDDNISDLHFCFSCGARMEGE